MKCTLELSDHGVRLKPTHTTIRVVVTVCLLIGLPTALFGALATWGATIEGEDPAVAFGLLGFGLAFVGAAIAFGTQRHIPRALVFDNRAATLVVDDGPRHQASLRYDEIAGFELGTHRRDQHVTWTVDIVKRDGAFWTVCNGKEEAMTAWLDQLRQHVDLDAVCRDDQIAISGSNSPIEVDEETWETRVRWPYVQSFARNVGGLLLIGGFILCMQGFVKEPWLRVLLQGFLGVLWLLMLVSWVRLQGAHHRVRVDSAGLTSEGPGLIGTRSQRVPIDDIDVVLFLHGMSQEESGLMLMKQDQVDTLVRARRGQVALADIVDIMRTMLSIPKLPMNQMRFTERMQLEAAIQDAVRRHGGSGA